MMFVIIYSYCIFCSTIVMSFWIYVKVVTVPFFLFALFYGKVVLLMFNVTCNYDYIHGNIYSLVVCD
jgi:hypothetical protein